ncbi:MAG: high frequency lysogenization protein HflD [Gammaproteobacteria bacterium]|nr:high frequency lysogenization protein HflD [Gammaproteobacteria bacterium]
MKSSTRDLAIALAGIFQAVRLVQLTANGEQRDERALKACLSGIFNTDPESADIVFGSLAGIRLGLETALDQIAGPGERRDMELARYAVTVMHLERKLNRNRALLDNISAGIKKAKEQARFFDITHSSVIASLADCYQQTISTLRPRIMVNGNQAVLVNPENQNLIRALLLAAIRAAVLWHQCGGGRLTLILQRKALVNASESLLDEARNIH